ncbi:MAG: ATP-binding protein, partial [Anaerolineae bacterium]
RDEAEVLKQLVAVACHLVPTGQVAAWLYDPAQTRLKLAAGQGPSPAAKDFSLTDSPVAQQALSQGVAQNCSPTLADPLCAPSLTLTSAWRLGVAGHPLGLLTIGHSATDTPPAEALAALSGLATAALTAIRRAAEWQQIDTSRAQFIRVTTHELRSPVAVAQTLIRNVVKGYAGPLTDKQKDVFTRISNQLDRLEGLVNDLLDLAASRSIADQALEPTLLNAAVGRAVLVLSPGAEEKGVSLTFRPCREELLIRATDDGLDRVFVNLISNAIKYTPAGGQVTVAFQRSNGHAVVTVSDTGMGIPAEAMAHLFQEFYRAPNVRAANITGTGLGLVIVKELVDKFHGKIHVESELGKGSTFTVTFPLLEPSNPSTHMRQI